MRRVKQFIIQTLVNDATINSYVNRLVVPMEFDFMPETLPAIVVWEIGGKHRSVPSTARDVLIQVDIWSNVNALNTDNIYERITQLLNTPRSSMAKLAVTSAGEQVYWIREDHVRDIPDPSRSIWHKAIIYRVWAVST